MDEEAREARNAYQRAWRARNKRRTSEINARYWKKRAQKLKEQREASGEERQKEAAVND